MLYRWPQGKIARVVAAILVLAIAMDLGWNGAYGRFAAYQADPSQTALMIQGGVLGALALVFLVGGAIAVGFYPKSAQFLIDVEQEMGKVTWPGRSDVVRSTIVISIMTAVLALVIFLVDSLILGGRDLVLSLGGG